MSIINVTQNNFNKTLENNSLLLLDFYADWCGPCQMVAPILKEIAEENPSITVGKINVDNEPILAEKFGVMSIPLLVAIRDGKIINQALGFRSKDEILNLIK